MKPFFFLAVLALLCSRALGQSFTVDALTDTLLRTENKPYLTSKGFVLCTDCAGEMHPEIYTKNKGAANAEYLNLYPGKGNLDYQSLDTAAISKLLREAKAKFKLTDTRHYDHAGADRRIMDTYMFTNGKSYLQFLIFSKYAIIYAGPEKK